jgi:hypothetical protein
MKMLERPRIVCLCGSTRFFDAFCEADFSESLAGRIVLSIAVNKAREEAFFNTLNAEELEKVGQQLQTLHFQKIDLADEILVINVNGYVGESATLEVKYAHQQGKPLCWLEPERVPEHLREFV